MESKQLKALNKGYLEAGYGQSAGQELAKREKDDDAAGAPNPKKKARFKVTDYDLKHTEAGKRYKAGNPNYTKEEIGGIEVQEVILEKEVKVKDTRRTVDAIRAYDKSKDASRDADWDTEHGEKEKGDIEKKYAKKERGEIKKDDPNWKNRKWHTGLHGEELMLAYNSIYEGGEPIQGEGTKGTLRKELKALKKGAETLKGKNVAKADEIADEFIPSETVSKLAESGQFSVEELWKIVEVEEGYQRNPEKGEAEERKAEKRRKESGAMPPRGDKRREEFERWYAANVR